MQKRMGHAYIGIGVIMAPISSLAAIGIGAIMAPMSSLAANAITPGIGLFAAFGTLSACVISSVISSTTVKRTKSEVERSLAHLSQPVSIRRPELSAGPHFAARTYYTAPTDRLLSEFERYLLESKLDVAKGHSHISGHGWRDGTVEANFYETNPGTMVDLLWLGLGAADAGRPEGLLARLASVQ